MMKPKYSPVQLGMALSKTVSQHRKELEKPIYPTKKIDWIKNTCDEIINLLEREVNTFNADNPGEELGGNDVVSAAQTTLNRLLKAMGMKAKKKD